MFAYQRMLRAIQKDGVIRPNRTGTDTLGIFGYQLRHDLSKGFPLLTTKKVFFKGVVEELLWMLRGETNVRSLQAAGVHIWDEWADADGELGPIYGAQWRHFGAQWRGSSAPGDDGPDQIKDVIDSIIKNPDSRRHIVSAWHPGVVPFQKLPPCHVMFQFDVRDGRLSCHMYQRSADAFLGVPFNIASYALLTHLIAYRTELLPGDLIISYGDLHIYRNHFDAVEEQLSRRPRKLPGLVLELPGAFSYMQLPPGDSRLNEPLPGDQRLTEPWDVKSSDIRVYDYYPMAAIKAPVAV